MSWAVLTMTFICREQVNEWTTLHFFPEDMACIEHRAKIPGKNGLQGNFYTSAAKIKMGENRKGGHFLPQKYCWFGACNFANQRSSTKYPLLNVSSVEAHSVGTKKKIMIIYIKKSQPEDFTGHEITLQHCLAAVHIVLLPSTPWSWYQRKTITQLILFRLFLYVEESTIYIQLFLFFPLLYARPFSCILIDHKSTCWNRNKSFLKHFLNSLNLELNVTLPIIPFLHYASTLDVSTPHSVSYHTTNFSTGVPLGFALPTLLSHPSLPPVYSTYLPFPSLRSLSCIWQRVDKNLQKT